MGSEISPWADAQQYRAEEMPEDVKASRRPKVTLLNATPDPLGSLAALCGIYTGRVVRRLSDVTDEERRQALEDMASTALSGPLESIQFHFLIEGVDRSFTHQAVRGRNAFYAQESLRFAVVDEEPWVERSSLPPSLEGTKPLHEDLRAPQGPGRTKEQLMRNTWDRAVSQMQMAYQSMIAYGMPAEEARGLMPHSMQTRYHWMCTLRELLHVAGMRTCTQAQFHWRLVMAEIARCLREHRDDTPTDLKTGNKCDRCKQYFLEAGVLRWHQKRCAGDAWQFELLADKIRPVCYQTGRCGFMAKFDRACTIRERVDSNTRAQRPSSEWGTPKTVERCGADSDCPGGCGSDETVTLIKPIQDWEWAADPAAART